MRGTPRRFDSRSPMRHLFSTSSPSDTPQGPGGVIFCLLSRWDHPDCLRTAETICAFENVSGRRRKEAQRTTSVGLCRANVQRRCCKRPKDGTDGSSAGRRSGASMWKQLFGVGRLVPSRPTNATVAPGTCHASSRQIPSSLRTHRANDPATWSARSDHIVRSPPMYPQNARDSWFGHFERNRPCGRVRGPDSGKRCLRQWDHVPKYADARLLTAGNTGRKCGQLVLEAGRRRPRSASRMSAEQGDHVSEATGPCLGSVGRMFSDAGGDGFDAHSCGADRISVVLPRLAGFQAPNRHVEHAATLLAVAKADAPGPFC